MLRLNSEQQRMVIENEGLVYFAVKKYFIHSNTHDYEELCSEGKIGLMKAVMRFDPQEGSAFSTYAVKYINGQIYKYITKNKKASETVPIGDLSTINLNKSNFFKTIAAQDEMCNILTIILNCLSIAEKTAMIYLLSGLPYSKIAKILNFHKSYIGQIVKKSRVKILNIIEQNNNYEKTYLVSSQGDRIYLIIFPNGYKHKVIIDNPQTWIELANKIK